MALSGSEFTYGFIIGKYSRLVVVCVGCATCGAAWVEWVLGLLSGLGVGSGCWLRGSYRWHRCRPFVGQLPLFWDAINLDGEFGF